MKSKKGVVTLPVTALTVDQLRRVEELADQGMVSKTAILRQCIAVFVDQPEDTISSYVNRDYGQAFPFTNVYCPESMALALDALAEKFDKARNQIIRAAVQQYLDKNSGN